MPPVRRSRRLRFYATDTPNIVRLIRDVFPRHPERIHAFVKRLPCSTRVRQRVRDDLLLATILYLRPTFVTPALRTTFDFAVPPTWHWRAHMPVPSHTNHTFCKHRNQRVIHFYKPVRPPLYYDRYDVILSPDKMEAWLVQQNTERAFLRWLLRQLPLIPPLQERIFAWVWEYMYK